MPEGRTAEIVVEVRNTLGIHSNPTMWLVDLVVNSEHAVQMAVSYSGGDGPSAFVDASEVMSVINASARCGDRLTFRVTGPEPERVAAALRGFVEVELPLREGDRVGGGYLAYG